MVLYKVTPPQEENIVTRNKFVVDSILPIGIKAGSNSIYSLSRL